MAGPVEKKIRLPEKDWFSLEEIALRWNCIPNDLIHQAGIGKLRVGFVTSGLEVEVWDLPFHRFDVQLIGFLTLHSDTLLRIDAGEEFSEVSILLPLPEEPPLRSIPTLPMDDTEGLEVRLERERDFVSSDVLAIARVERDRFEREQGITPSTNEFVLSESMDDRSEKTYLRIIRVMAAEMDLPSEKYKAATVLEAAAARHGMEIRSLDTLAKYLDKARRIDE